MIRKTKAKKKNKTLNANRIIYSGIQDVHPVYGGVRGRTLAKKQWFFWDMIAESGVLTVIDLRESGEHTHLPTLCRKHGIQYFHYPINKRDEVVDAMIELFPEYCKRIDEGNFYIASAKGLYRTDIALCTYWVFYAAEKGMAPPAIYGYRKENEHDTSNIMRVLNSFYRHLTAHNGEVPFPIEVFRERKDRIRELGITKNIRENILGRRTLILCPSREGRMWAKKNHLGKFGRHERNLRRSILSSVLTICANKGNYYRLVDTILYNIPLRDRIRACGLHAFVEELKGWRFSDEEFAENMDRFEKEYSDLSIGDFDIQIYGDDEDFIILNHTFHGLSDLKDQVELYVNGSSTSNDVTKREPKNPDALHVGEVYYNYPCFDFEDFINEDRTYQNYIIRENPITEEDLKNVIEAPNLSNHKKTHEKMSQDLLPMVYYDGDSGYILVATK